MASVRDWIQSTGSALGTREDQIKALQLSGGWNRVFSELGRQTVRSAASDQDFLASIPTSLGDDAFADVLSVTVAHPVLQAFADLDLPVPDSEVSGIVECEPEVANRIAVWAERLGVLRRAGKTAELVLDDVIKSALAVPRALG